MVGKKLGEGSFGVVYRASFANKSSKVCAITSSLRGA